MAVIVMSAKRGRRVPSQSATNHRNWEHTLAVFTVFLAAVLRLTFLDLVQYREDDDALWNIITRMAHTGHVPISGMHSSIGLPNGPFQALLLAPFGWANANPALMTAGVGMLNVLAVALVFGFTRDFFGRRVALVATLLTAVNPWAVVLSRRLWGDDMVAPFAVLALWMLCRWLCRGANRLLPVAACALAIVAQVYIVGLECLATAALALALGFRRLRSRWTLVALFVFVALSAPYVAGAALARVPALATIGSAGSSPAVIDLSAARYALDLASEEGYQAFAMQGGSHLDATSGLPAVVGMLARLLYLLGLATGLWTVLRGTGKLNAAPRAVHLLLLVSVIVPILALLRHAVPVYPYYLVTTFPAPYLYQALGLRQLWRWTSQLTATARRCMRGVLLSTSSALVTVPLALAATFFSLIGQYWPAAIYGMPWTMSNGLATETVQLQQRYGATRILVPVAGQELNVLYRMLVQRGAPAQEFDDERLLMLAAEKTVYLAIGNAPAQQYLAAHYAQFLVRQETLPGAGVPVCWYLLPASVAHTPLPAGTAALNWTYHSDQQQLLRLDGVQLPSRVQPGATLTATVFLTPLVRPDVTVPDFSLFLHLLNSRGQTVAGGDEPALPSQAWRPGDRIVQWFTVGVPKETSAVLLHSSLGVYSVGVPGHAVINPLLVSDAANRELGNAGTGPALLVPPAPPAPPSRLLRVSFAQGIILQGDDIQQRGSTLTVTLHWLAGAAVPVNYTAFVHLLDGTGKLIAQHDGPPASGAFPSSLWRRGDYIADVHTIALPAGLPPGTYHLEFGLYDGRTLQRLAVTSGQPLQAVSLP